MSANRVMLAAFTVMALRGPCAMAQVTPAPLAHAHGRVVSDRQ